MPPAMQLPMLLPTNEKLTNKAVTWGIWACGTEICAGTRRVVAMMP